MRRWWFILLGGFGAGLSAWAAFMLWLAPVVPPRLTVPLMVGEIISIVLGLILCIVGFVQGRRAGEMDITQYTKTPRRDYGVAGAELDFQCPLCKKGYRASPLLAGKPFTCRDCREVFDVPVGRGGGGQSAAKGIAGLE
jgi:hypothetical protein